MGGIRRRGDVKSSREPDQQFGLGDVCRPEAITHRGQSILGYGDKRSGGGYCTGLLLCVQVLNTGYAMDRVDSSRQLSPDGKGCHRRREFQSVEKE